MKPKSLLLALCCVAVAGCASLLPRGDTDTPSPFQSFAQAQDAAEKIVPFKTSMGELKSLGFDFEAGANVTVVPYPDVLARLAPYSGVPMDTLDAGIQECIKARNACRGWLFHFERLDHKREGGFWGDFFNVRRVTKITGWSFDALVVASNGTVLFRNTGGQANIDRVERQHNPLGPLQPAGESAGSVLLR